MNAPHFSSGHGSCHFRLGIGSEATGGDLELDLHCAFGKDCSVSVDWQSPLHGIPDEARQKIVSYLDWYLRDYLELHPVGALSVVVTQAGWSMERRNEPERAAFLAVHQAMTNAKLPPRPLFAPPDEEAEPSGPVNDLPAAPPDRH